MTISPFADFQFKSFRIINVMATVAGYFNKKSLVVLISYGIPVIYNTSIG
jgi:hypothetical protein